MNRCFFLVTLVFAQTGCDADAEIGPEEAKPLSYVGEVLFGQPIMEDLDVVVDLAFSGGSWHEDSIVPSSVDVIVLGNRIEFTVLGAVATTPPIEGSRLVLPPGTKGRYTVYYRDPDRTLHRIGALEI